MVSYICVVLCFIQFSHVWFHIISWWSIFIPCLGWGECVQGSPKVTELVQGAQRGELLAESKCRPRYCVLCRAWEHCSCHMLAKVGPVTEVHREAEPHSWISVLPLAQVPLQKEIHFLILIPSWHYFCILCILLEGEAVRLSAFWMCKHQISVHCSEL